MAKSTEAGGHQKAGCNGSLLAVPYRLPHLSGAGTGKIFQIS